MAETSTATAGNYVFETLPLGNYRFRYSNPLANTSWSRPFLQTELGSGLTEELPSVFLQNMFVFIEGDAAATNNPVVTLNLGAMAPRLSVTTGLLVAAASPSINTNIF